MSEDKKNPPTEPPQDENQIIAERRAKLARLREKGQAFPNDFVREHLAADLHAAHGAATKEDLQAAAPRACVAGRMMLKRLMGKASFATLQDMSGRIQVYVKADLVGAEAYEAFKHWDLGDIVGAEGALFRTNTGELTIQVTSIRLLSKSLRPLPDKFHGLADMEVRYRQRYVDLIVNPESRENFIKRSRLVQAIREFFVERGYLEVETPMLHPIPGGAAAKPFTTHHNALDMEMFLRIAPELYLKKLVVGGLEKVFEINRNFRNEGISTRHNPEFTMIEFYEAYRDHHYLMDLTETLLRECAQKILGKTALPYQGETSVGCATMKVGCTSFDSVVASKSLSCSRPSPSVGNTSTWKGPSAALRYSGFASSASGYLGLYLAMASAIVRRSKGLPRSIVSPW